MNFSNANPPASQSKKLPSVVGDNRRNDFDGMFDVATTIERLCKEGAIDLGQPLASSQMSCEFNSPKLECDKLDGPANAFSTFDVLSTHFLQSIVNHISLVSGRSIGLLLTSKSGSIIQSVQSGWDASDFRIQSLVLAKIAKESAWRKGPRYSTNVLLDGHVELCSEADTTKPLVSIETSACLNELSSVVGSPIGSIPLTLKESSGVAVFLCDATSTTENGTTKDLTDFGQLWIGQEGLESLARQLDTWLIVQRCNWFNRIVGWMELIRSRPQWWMIPMGIVCIALIAPIPYYPRRDCVFEPETKQFLSSPIQGRIASCEVRPGDRVEKGQLMARLDDDQLRRDLATAQSEHDGANKRLNSALATRATGNSVLAKIEMTQANWKIESIEDHLRRLEIKATTSGIVVQGDWQRSVGMPLTLGQSLFEVAELESMTAEVRLLASDLSQINVGDEVSVRSDASGVATFRGKISRIEPRATIIDDSAVFIADVVIRDPDMQLRPGMKASAQINAGWRTLGWYLFNRPYRWIANQWIW